MDHAHGRNRRAQDRGKCVAAGVLGGWRGILFADPKGWIAEIGADGRWRRGIVKAKGAPFWSPDGRRVLYQGPDGLYVIGTNRKRRMRLTHPPRLRQDLAPAWQFEGHLPGA